MPSSTFNGPLWNGNLFGGGQSTMEAFSSDLVVFNGFSLSDGVSIVCSNLIDSGPNRDIIGANVPRGDGMFINGSFWRQKTIEVRGIVQRSTAAELDAYLDEIRKRLRATEGNLDITRHGTARRFIATLVNAEELFSERQGYHITTCPFVARFVCKTPFGMDRSYTTSTFSFSSSPRNETLQNIGTIEAQPVFILIFNSATSVTTVNIKRLDTNGTILDEIEYSGTINSGDILRFDSENKIVTLNDQQVAYTGAFPRLDIGSNTIKFDVNGTFSVTATDKFRNRYL